MSKCDDKRNQRYVYHPMDRSKLNCLINVPGNSPDECRVLNDFGSNYTKGKTSKEQSQDPKFNIFLENRKGKNDMFQHAFDEKILQEKEKLSVKDETHENIDDEIDEYQLYDLEK